MVPKRPKHLAGLTDLLGKRAVVTGANSGIGRQIAENLAILGADVTLACRSETRGNEAAAGIREAAPNVEIDVMVLDQSSQKSVRDFANAFEERHRILDILVNNAGIYPEARKLTEDGVEIGFATNVMGYFSLTRALQPCLARGVDPRVLFIASKLAGGLELDDLQFETRAYNGIAVYKQSKQANRMLARRFAETLAPSGIKVAAIHPGGVRTSIGRHQKGIWGVLVRLAFLTQKPTTTGADTATWLAQQPFDDLETGRFWADRAERSCEFVDAESERALWRACEELEGG